MQVVYDQYESICASDPLGKASDIKACIPWMIFMFDIQ